jgi:hypothetical protein
MNFCHEMSSNRIFIVRISERYYCIAMYSKEKYFCLVNVELKTNVSEISSVSIIRVDLVNDRISPIRIYTSLPKQDK